MAAAAETALEQLADAWDARYPALIRMWRSCWSESIPFLDDDVEVRRVLCSTNAIESLNCRYRRAIKARGHFLSEAAALECLYLVTRSLDPKGTGQQRCAIRWKPALNAPAVTFADRMPDLNRGWAKRHLHQVSERPLRPLHAVADILPWSKWRRKHQAIVRACYHRKHVNNNDHHLRLRR